MKKIFVPSTVNSTGIFNTSTTFSLSLHITDPLIGDARATARPPPPVLIFPITSPSIQGYSTVISSSSHAIKVSGIVKIIKIKN